MSEKQSYADQLRALAESWMEEEALKKAMEEGTFGTACSASALVSCLASVLPLMGKMRVKISAEAYGPKGPKIVCLCGSTRFWREFQRASLAETLAGHIVLSIGAASGTDDEHFGNLPREEYDRLKERLDDLHKRKIDLADEVLILNVGGYIGDSTRSELEYARKLNKPVRWLEGGQDGR